MSLVACIIRNCKKWKAKSDMKNNRKKGKSARNGNSPAPYTKYKKTPYKYSFNTGKVTYLDIRKDEKEDYNQKRKNRKAA